MGFAWPLIHRGLLYIMTQVHKDKRVLKRVGQVRFVMLTFAWESEDGNMFNESIRVLQCLSLYCKLF